VPNILIPDSITFGPEQALLTRTTCRSDFLANNRVSHSALKYLTNVLGYVGVYWPYVNGRVESKDWEWVVRC